MINMILASTAVGGIGLNNSMPWHYSEDMKVFKALTVNQKIIMGKNTWLSLPKRPLPNRDNFVLSKTYTDDNVLYSPKVINDNTTVMFADDVNELFRYLRDNDPQDMSQANKKNVWVIGGASIYKQFASMCSYVQHTVIRKNYECDTYFNPLTEMDLELVSEVSTGADSGIIFRLYYRRNSIFKKNKEFEEKTTELIRSTLGVSKEATT